MSDKEKLVELLMQLEDNLCDDCGRDPVGCAVVAIADHLIANGVRLETKQATSDGWIPVEERLPDLIPCGAGTAYSEAVNVLTSGRKVLTAIWDGEDFIADADFWDAEGEEITHWTPVLLPLPESTKEVIVDAHPVCYK